MAALALEPASSGRDAVVGQTGTVPGTPARAVWVEAPRGAGDTHVLLLQGLVQPLAGSLN